MHGTAFSRVSLPLHLCSLWSLTWATAVYSGATDIMDPGHCSPHSPFSPTHMHTGVPQDWVSRELLSNFDPRHQPGAYWPIGPHERAQALPWTAALLQALSPPSSPQVPVFDTSLWMAASGNSEGRFLARLTREAPL